MKPGKEADSAESGGRGTVWGMGGSEAGFTEWSRAHETVHPSDPSSGASLAKKPLEVLSGVRNEGLGTGVPCWVRRDRELIKGHVDSLCTTSRSKDCRWPTENFVLPSVLLGCTHQDKSLIIKFIMVGDGALLWRVPNLKQKIGQLRSH